MAFVGTTYLHLAGATALTALSASTPITTIPYWNFITAVVSLVFFIILLFMAPGPLKYAVFVAYLLFLGQALSEYAKTLGAKGLLDEVIGSVFGIFLAMSVAGYYAGNHILRFGPLLFIALVGLIIGRLGLIVAGVTDTVSMSALVETNSVLSWIGTVLFSVFVAYDTAQLQARARLREKNPDYIDASMGLFLDIINLFRNVGDIIDE